ncbi:MAG: hypothetical protein ACFFDN_36245, partial [Candidatus Hodarchaeota archaeon]
LTQKILSQATNCAEYSIRDHWRGLLHDLVKNKKKFNSGSINSLALDYKLLILTFINGLENKKKTHLTTREIEAEYISKCQEYQIIPKQYQTILKRLRELSTLGIIKVEKLKVKPRGRRNFYHLSILSPDSLEKSLISQIRKGALRDD